MRSLAAATAYQRSATYRHPRQQEADVFLLVNAGLQNGSTSGPMTIAKALADNELLWITVMDLLRDPANQLPADTRAAVLSIGYAARREMASATPDVAFLVGLNEQIANGLNASGTRVPPTTRRWAGSTDRTLS